MDMFTMEDLYNEMKAILGAFNLRFSDMNKVAVKISDKGIHFSYNNREFIINTGAE